MRNPASQELMTSWLQILLFIIAFVVFAIITSLSNKRGTGTGSTSKSSTTSSSAPVVSSGSSSYKPTATPSTKSNYCPGAAGPRLTVGQYAYICASDGVWLKDKPGYGTLIHYLPPKTTMKVLSGPKCVFYDAINYKGERVGDQEYHYFWYVSVPSTGETGWIAEGQDSEDWYYLCPM